MVPPPILTSPGITSHPLAAMPQRIRLTGEDGVKRRHRVYASGFEGTPLAPFYERLGQDPSWRVRALPHGHDIVAEAPDGLLRILLEAAE
ncbi:hypothetical protein [Kitasatospora sp. NPDC058190]|uniref:hypothetical protein n=1 Tax=Kitasatospora sp. NPDC058190 TaxID=3346371 RepID=UPI0036D85064